MKTTCSRFAGLIASGLGVLVSAQPSMARVPRRIPSRVQVRVPTRATPTTRAPRIVNVPIPSPRTTSNRTGGFDDAWAFILKPMTDEQFSSYAKDILGTPLPAPRNPGAREVVGPTLSDQVIFGMYVKDGIATVTFTASVPCEGDSGREVVTYSKAATQHPAIEPFQITTGTERVQLALPETRFSGGGVTGVSQFGGQMNLELDLPHNVASVSIELRGPAGELCINRYDLRLHRVPGDSFRVIDDFRRVDERTA